MKSNARRSFLRSVAITVAGLTLVPKMIFGKQSESEHLASGESIFNPDLYDLKLSPDPYDGFKMENDVVGARLWGPITQPTLSIGKSDIWDRRWFEERQPLVTMAKIKALAMSDRLAEICPTSNVTIYNIYNKYDFPCPKPGGQLILGVPFALDARFKSNEDGSVRMLVTGKNKRLIIDIWVSLMHPAVIIECAADGLEKGDFWLRTYRHQDTIKPGNLVNPSCGNVKMPDDFEQLPGPTTYFKNDCWGIEQNFIPDSTFPGGFEYSLLSAAIGISPEIEQQNNEYNLGTPLLAEKEGRIGGGVYKFYTPINDSPGSATTATFRKVTNKFAILSVIETTQDTGGLIIKTVSSLNKLKKRGVDSLRNEQIKAFKIGKRETYAKIADTNIASTGLSFSGTKLFAFPNLRKKGGYYGDIPVVSYNYNTTKFCYQDSSSWHGDYHLNELRADSLLTLGQFEAVYLYCEMIHTMLRGAQENAREVYGLPGAMYPLLHFPLRCRKGLAHTNLTWEQDFGLNGIICKPLWLYYRYTGDIGFLKEFAYPVMSECARFMQAYLTEGDDGLLHLIPTVSPEHWGLTKNFERNKDCTSALTLTRYLLRASAEAATILGIDSAEAAAWKKSTGRLANYPTFQTETGPIWVDVEGAPPIRYNIPVPLTPVCWGDEIGLDSLPEDIAIAKRTLEHIQKNPDDYSRINGWYLPARLGIPSEPTGPDHLLLSYQSIHIFPAVPPTGKIEMGNYAAEGGFRVSAKRTFEGEIFDVRIKSNLGGNCRIFNPWNGKKIRIVKGNLEVPYLADEKDIISFHTIKNETYILRRIE